MSGNTKRSGYSSSRVWRWFIQLLRQLPVPECMQCGVCCAPGSFRAAPLSLFRFIRLSDRDVRRLPDRSQVLFGTRAEDGGKRFLRVMPDDTDEKLPGDPDRERCAYLRGQLHESVSCGVYEARPSACRTFPRGGRVCTVMRLRDLARRWGVNPGRFPFPG